MNFYGPCQCGGLRANLKAGLLCMHRVITDTNETVFKKEKTDSDSRLMGPSDLILVTCQTSIVLMGSLDNGHTVTYDSENRKH